MHASAARAFFFLLSLFPNSLSSLFLNSQPPPPLNRFRMTTTTPSKKSKATSPSSSPKRNTPSRSTRSRSLTPTRPSSASKKEKKKGEEEDDDGEESEEEEEEEDIQPTMEKKEKKRRRSHASSSPSPSPSLPPVASNKRRMTMKKINEEEEEDVSLTNAYAETNLVKTRFVKEFKARSERAMEAEEEAASLRVKLAESELRRVSAEAKVLAMTKSSDGDGQTPSAATTTAKGEGKTKRRSASPMVVSPTRRSTRATSADKELAENEENNNNNNALVAALVPTANDENYYSPLMMKREIEARERAETERDKLREQLVALKTRHAALEKKVMDDEGDELEDEVKEENKIIEKLRKRLEKAETVNAELEMEVADLRSKRNERKAVEAKLEEALEMNEELKNALEEERKSLLEKNNASNNNNNNNNNNKVLKELIEEKEHTIKILRQEMKSLEASAARGDMLHSKMVSVEAVEERLRSTEAKLSRANENVRAKEIENESLQRAVKNAGKWSSALLEEGPEELKNRVGALQSETLSLSEKLAEATKALKVEQTKRELFESKAKEEEEAINALEKQLETAKMDALNAKSIVEAKDSEIASLQKMAENERKGEKILQMKSSPFTNEIIRGLEKEITKLKNSNNNCSSNNNRNNNNTSSSDEIIANLQKKEQRLLVAFKSTVLKFREAVKLLFGFNIELVGEKASKTQFLITSVANESATLLFNYDEAKHSVSLEKNDPSWERHSESLKKNFTLYVEKEEEDEKNSPGTTTSFGVPAFLSNWNMDMYNNTNNNNN